MKILIATDGSEFSRQAVEKCREIIGKGNAANIKIISLVERPMPMATEPFAISGEYYLALEKDLQNQAEKAVSEAEEIVRRKTGGDNISLESEVFTGNIKRIIIDEAEKFGANLIVVGSHGYGFFNRMLLGSVSDFVVHHAPCSVLVVKTANDGAKE